MLTEEEKDKTRHHLGYLAVMDSQTFVLGVPAGVQTQFMVEGAFNRILPSAETRFRQLLRRLDGVEEQIERDMENVAVDEIGNIKLRKDEFKELIRRYQWWRNALANLMGIQPNPYDQRFSSWNGGSGINVPVF